jgi:predicted phage-related endonuclease
MGADEAALLSLWREKRGEVAPEDLARSLLVQLGRATENLNRRWFEQETRHRLSQVEHFVRHPVIAWMGATLDGMTEHGPSLYEAKFMLPWSFSEEAAAEKHMAQLQHNMLVTGARHAFLSIITGGGKWVLIEVEADPVYQTVLVQVERAFWRCVETGEVPRLCGAEPPKAKRPVTRIVDMAGSNSWAEFAATFISTRAAHAEHEAAKSELKQLMPEDAREAHGHGVRAKRSKAGAISFDLLVDGGRHADLQ